SDVCSSDLDLLTDIKALISDAEKSRPRSMQRELGPSGVSYHCKRRLAYSVVNSRKTSPSPNERGANRYSDPLPSIIGTATHAWLEEAARSANERLGRVRWVPEQRVTVREGLSGTCDLYDVDTQSILDWKVIGATSHKKYVTHGPSHVYRGQAHLYGKGYTNLGLPVKYVGIIFIKKAGSLRDIHLWREPYSP